MAAKLHCHGDRIHRWRRRVVTSRALWMSFVSRHGTSLPIRLLRDSSISQPCRIQRFEESMRGG